MTDTIKNHKITISIGTIVGLCTFLVASAFSGGIEVSSAESELKAQMVEKDTILDGKISNNLSEIKMIKDKFETQQNYLYSIKADLKAEIKNTDEKVDKIYNLLINR